MTLSLWETIKDNSSSVIKIGAGVLLGASVPLFSYAAHSNNDAQQHVETGEWAAALASKVNFAMTTGNYTVLDEVVNSLNAMVTHCEASEASSAHKATLQNVFASLLFITSALYVGVKAYKALSPPQQGYSPLNAS